MAYNSVWEKFYAYVDDNNIYLTTVDKVKIRNVLDSHMVKARTSRRISDYRTFLKNHPTIRCDCTACGEDLRNIDKEDIKTNT